MNAGRTFLRYFGMTIVGILTLALIILLLLVPVFVVPGPPRGVGLVFTLTYWLVLLASGVALLMTIEKHGPPWKWKKED